MPIAAVLYHCELKRVYNKNEHLAGVIVKWVIFVYFWTLMFLGLVYKSDTLKGVLSLTLVLVPIYTLVYTYLIFNTKCMTARVEGIRGG